jgi:hypothetical protein
LLFVGCGTSANRVQPDERFCVSVSADKLRAKPGEAVSIMVKVTGKEGAGAPQINAVVLEPTSGVRELPLNSENAAAGIYKGVFRLSNEAKEGLYAVTVLVASARARAIGKTAFIVGKVIGDFFPIADLQEEDIVKYLKEFQALGGNLLIIHPVVSGEKALYPSKICETAVKPGSQEDKVELTLSLTDRFGMPAILSVVWDVTHQMPYSRRTESVKALAKELWELYGHHASVAGFYSYQEGSGTYFAGYMREFCDAVKSLNSGLLTACAPYIDDPLLAGYLAAIDSLDIVIYQGAVMASYRPDNRKMYPIRRVKDFASLSSGATLIRNKITLTHVELFGYDEMSVANSYLTSGASILRQILSAATSYGPDGITLFTYYQCIYSQAENIPEAKKGAVAVKDGIKAYRLVSSAATETSHIALYYPYSDWCIDRWANSFTPALDSFKSLGLSVDIIPFIPPAGEEVLPYYPMNLNKEQLNYLLENKFIMVLPDISGMQETDSILLKDFVKEGGVAVLFGPSIPYGDNFDRRELCGGKEKPPSQHEKIEVKEALQRRVSAGATLSFHSTNSPSWQPTTGRAIAVFEDGTAAVLLNEFGKGKVLTIPVSVSQAVRIMSDLVRDILDYSLLHRGVKRHFDVLCESGDIDLTTARVGEEERLVVVNHSEQPVSAKIRPLNLDPRKSYSVTDLRTGKMMLERKGENFGEAEMRIGACDFIAIALKAKN